jgi:methyltransferase (TIGR00027 family)
LCIGCIRTPAFYATEQHSYEERTVQYNGRSHGPARAIEAQRPEDWRICYDPLAGSLLNGVSVFLSKLVIASGMYERFGVPGAIASITARERYIDDYLTASPSEGLDQVVILAQGSIRAYRIPGIEKTRVFEVDRSATQEVKLRRLKKVIVPLPDHVTFVPVDFNTQVLGERLQASGYNKRGKTQFNWKGVTMYLTPEGIDGTLALIANHSGQRGDF